MERRIFEHVLRAAAAANGIGAEPLLGAVGADHHEALCLADFSDRNVRALQSLASEIVARVRTANEPPEDAARRVFGERLSDSPVARRGAVGTDDASSHYERNRDRIVRAFHAARGNLSETERALKSEGLRVSRRWLAEFLRRWGVRS